MARLFGVTPKAVRDIWRAKTWADLTSAPHAARILTENTVIVEDLPRKRAKRMNEPMPHALNSSPYPHEGPLQAASCHVSIAQNEIPIPPTAKALQPPAPFARPARFSSASHAQIDSILTSPQASNACITTAPIFQPPRLALSFAEVAVFQNDGAHAPQQPTAQPRYAPTSGEREGMNAPQQALFLPTAPYLVPCPPPPAAATAAATSGRGPQTPAPAAPGLEPPDYLYTSGAWGAGWDAAAAADLITWADGGADHWAGAGSPPPERPPTPSPESEPPPPPADFALARISEEEEDGGGSSSGSDSDSDWPDPAEPQSAPWRPGWAPCPSPPPPWAAGAFALCEVPSHLYSS